jgi:ribonuclease D
VQSFENGGPILSLPVAPRWVDSVVELDALEVAIQDEQVLAIDTEWCDDSSARHTRIATLQVAFPGCHQSWVIDLLQPCPSFQAKARQLVLTFFSGSKTVVGFAMGHDLPKLEEWLEEAPLSRSVCLDLQLLFRDSSSQMPGLAACAARFSSLPLSKKEQCSDWKLRPLRTSQLEYAGLDAALLLALLAERRKEYSQEQSPSET